MTRRSGVATLSRGLLLALGTLWAIGACSSKSSSHADPPDAGVATADAGCKLGDTQDCTFEQLCRGSAKCLPDGSFGACECSSVPNDGSTGIVGAKCESDVDCLGGAQCMTALSNQYANGGPAGGYCTYSCTTTTDCTSHDTDSDCVPVGSTGQYCIRKCLSKDPEPGEAKCLSRPDLVCESIAADGVMGFTPDRQDGFCAPMCGSDQECPAGRYCNRRNHVCFPIPSAGAPTGSSCTLENDCDGHACENRVNGVGTCTASCTVGSLAGCGFASDATSRTAACLTVQVAAGGFSEGAGDLGFCRELCDVDADCIQASQGWVCKALSDAAAAFFGRKGACVPSSAN